MKKLCFYKSFLIIIFSTNVIAQHHDIALPHVVSMTPNAAELAKYADYPISHYTGTPNISVPLYELVVDDLKLPISLNYHASGIKVNQESSWVGLGWSLNVENRITRSVNSVDDFLIDYFDFDYGTVTHGYYDAPAINHNNLLSNYDFYADIACPPVIGDLSYRLKYDPEPDIFYYNLPNYAGKFILEKGGGGILFNKEHNLKIEINRVYNNKINFKITDKEGNQYFYNQWEITRYYANNGFLNRNNTSAIKHDDNITDYVKWILTRYPNCSVSLDPEQMFPYEMASSWVLNRIKTNKGKEINFNYVEEEQFLPTQESSEYYNCLFNSSGKFYQRSKVVNNSLRLNSINGDFGHIDFMATSREDIKGTAKKLEEIRIYNFKNDLIKRIKLDYSYFNDNFNGNPIYKHVFKRLKLNGVKDYAVTDFTKSIDHTFEYYEGDFPAKNSKNVDYWGFQNGRIYGEDYYIGLSYGGSGSNNLLIPGVKKDMNFQHAIKGTLKKINYPTGGNTEFIFESHKIPLGFFEEYTYEPYGNNNYALQHDIEIYNYHSVWPPWFEELPPSQDTFQFELTSNKKVYISGNLENQTGEYDPSSPYHSYNPPIGNLRRISPNPQTIHNYVCPFLYEGYFNSELGIGSEHNFGELEYNLSPGIYEFKANTPPQDVHATWHIRIPNYYNPPYGTPFDAGGIRIKEIVNDSKVRKFNYQLGQMLVEPFLYYYGRRAGGNQDHNPCIIQVSESKTPLSTFGNGNTVGYDWVEEYLEDGNNVSKTRFNFFNDTESEFFDDNFPDSPRYINYRNGKIISVEKFKNNELIEKQEYEYDSNFSSYIYAFRDRSKKFYFADVLTYYYRIEYPKLIEQKLTLFYGNNTIENVSNFNYNDKNIIETKTYNHNGHTFLEEYKYPFNFSDLVSNEMTTKNQIGTPVEIKLYRNNVKLSESFVQYKNWGNNLLLPEIVKTSKDNSPLESRIVYNHIDNVNGNLLELKQESSMPISYIWGYNKTLPIAKIENATYSQIQPFEANLQDLSNGNNEAMFIQELNNLRTALPNAMITTYIHNPLVGVSRITDYKGDTQTYHYDIFNRLKEVRDKDNNLLQEHEYWYKTQN